MTSEEPSSQRKQRTAKIGFFVVVLVAMVSTAYVLFYLNASSLISPYWDDGKWSEPMVVNCNEPSIVEFGDKIYMFYSVITENTISNYDDIVIGPAEHILTDILYRVFDGENFSEPIPLTSTSDKVSVTGNYFVFEDKLYAALSEWWISDHTSYETKSHVRLEVFDGDSWSAAQGPLGESEMGNHGLPKYFVYSGKAWIVWQNTDGHGHLTDSFSFKTFDGDSWSGTSKFTIPANNPGDWRPFVTDDQLWFVWSNTSFYNDPVRQFEPHQDVWLGRFDNDGWNNVTLLSAVDDTGPNFSFFLIKYQDELCAFWGGSYFDTSEHGEWVWVLRRFSLSDGALDELTPVIPESGYKCSPWSTCVFDGRLYVLWYSAYQKWKSMIVAFNGTDWSSIHHFDRGYDADGLFVYKDKLWAYGTYGSSQLNEAGWTYIRSYNRSG